jgi:hypothetical protein
MPRHQSTMLQALPFHSNASRRKPISSPPAGDSMPMCGYQLYGGGTLPPGFEHLESLRRHRPPPPCSPYFHCDIQSIYLYSLHAWLFHRSYLSYLLSFHLCNVACIIAVSSHSSSPSIISLDLCSIACTCSLYSRAFIANSMDGDGIVSIMATALITQAHYCYHFISLASSAIHHAEE